MMFMFMLVLMSFGLMLMWKAVFTISQYVYKYYKIYADYRIMIIYLYTYICYYMLLLTNHMYHWLSCSLDT